MLDVASIQAAGEGLAFLPDAKEYPDIVPGRVVHIDADFLAYYASYEREGETKDLAGITMACNTMLEDLRRSCGAEKAVTHTTPSGSNKGGRYEVAIQKAYQATRSNPDKPRLLEEARKYLSGGYGTVGGGVVESIAWTEAEADDGMAQAAWKALSEGNQELCVIASKDKDLRMVPGLHFNFDTGAVEGADDTFGYIKIQTNVRIGADGKEKKSHKPRGYGTKFFWWQMLMGDAADNISGIPRVGIVKAGSMLEGCNTDYECLQVVKEAYKDYGTAKGFKHWDTGEPVSWSDVMKSEAQLLWMQREAGKIEDVLDFMRETVKLGM